VLILRGLKEDGAGPDCELVCSGVAQAGATSTHRPMDNPPYRDLGASAATPPAQVKSTALLENDQHSPHSSCSAFKHMKSAHSPSVLPKGGEREHVFYRDSWIAFISKQSLFN